MSIDEELTALTGRRMELEYELARVRALGEAHAFAAIPDFPVDLTRETVLALEANIRVIEKQIAHWEQLKLRGAGI